MKREKMQAHWVTVSGRLIAMGCRNCSRRILRCSYLATATWRGRAGYSMARPQSRRARTAGWTPSRARLRVSAL